jgi:hypothetical protein
MERGLMCYLRHRLFARGAAPDETCAVPGPKRRRTQGLDVDQVIQIIGALLILSGFAGTQFGVLDQRSWTYLIVNALGSGILAVLGWYERQWGFFLLEFVWAIVSIWSMIGKYRGQEPGPAPH